MEMKKEKALITVNGGSQLMESEVIFSAIDFAQRGFGGLPVTLPKGYDITRSVKNFCFALPNVKNIDKVTKESIMQAAHDYITQGLDVAKHQCALIVYGNELTVQKEYFGMKAVALRLNPDIESISDGTIIFEGDNVSITYDTKGRTHIKHETSFANWSKEPVGVYVVVNYKDGSSDTEIMTVLECKTAWTQGKNGDAVHKKFPVEMMKKTCINRKCKKLINASDDSGLLEQPMEVPEYETLDFETVEDGILDESVLDAPSAPVLEPVTVPKSPEPVNVDTTAEDYKIRVPYKEYLERYKDCTSGNYSKSDKQIDVYPNRPKGQKAKADELDGQPSSLDDYNPFESD